MKLCQSHASDLLKVIKHKGMGKYHVEDPVAVNDFAQRWLAGAVLRHEFQPFTIATLEIFKKTEEILGSEFVRSQPVDACPLCMINKAYGKDVAIEWIDNVTDVLILHCHANDLKI